ncbi:MAG: type II toxin-antitoxin system Phd/YefM family antitoxin [Rhodospirillaceae bacterium]|nr:type II toxin-antitoxin system Phd/YefM family antitoxin [Rhodospirillaceae bacterium]
MSAKRRIYKTSPQRKSQRLAERSAGYDAGPPAKRGKGTAKANPLFVPADPTRTFDLTMTTVDARKHFAELLNRVAYGTRRVVLTRRGKPLVCVIPMADVDFIEELEDIMDAKAVDDAMREQGEAPYKSHEELMEELELAPR